MRPGTLRLTRRGVRPPSVGEALSVEPPRERRVLREAGMRKTHLCPQGPAGTPVFPSPPLTEPPDWSPVLSSPSPRPPAVAKCGELAGHVAVRSPLLVPSPSFWGGAIRFEHLEHGAGSTV